MTVDDRFNARTKKRRTNVAVYTQRVYRPLGIPEPVRVMLRDPANSKKLLIEMSVKEAMDLYHTLQWILKDDLTKEIMDGFKAK